MKKIKNFKEYMISLNENTADMDYLLDKITDLKQRGIDNWREHLTKQELHFLDDYHVSMKLPSRKQKTFIEDEYIQMFVDNASKFEVFVTKIEKDEEYNAVIYYSYLIFEGDKYEGFIKHYFDTEQVDWSYKIPGTDIKFNPNKGEDYYEFDDLANEVVEHFELSRDTTESSDNKEE